MTDAAFGVVKDLVGRGPVFADADAELIRSIYKALFDEAPVTVESIASHAGRSPDEVDHVLGECNVVYEGEEVIGFGGLSREPTPHVFVVGQLRRYTWCAWDPLFIARILDVEARVETVCPQTGTPITLSVSPEGIGEMQPASAVLSMRIPDESCRSDIVGNFCNAVHLFVSRDAARRWIGERTDVIVLTAEDGFDLGTVIVDQRTGRASPGSGETSS